MDHKGKNKMIEPLDMFQFDEPESQKDVGHSPRIVSARIKRINIMDKVSQLLIKHPHIER